MKLPLVSVVIPAYNASLFIAETLNSVIKQTYPNIEIIVVNDGSSDNTDSVISAFSSEINYLIQTNQGVSAARNKGLSIATGKYICFLDADDWFFPNNIEKKVDLLEKDISIALVHGIVDVTDSKLNSSGSQLKGKSGFILNELLNYAPPAIPCPSNAVIRTSILKELNGFDENLSTSADYDLWLRIAKDNKVGFIDKLSIKYRQHDANMFSNIALQIHDLEYIFNKHNKIKNIKRLKKNFYYSIAGAYYHKRRILSFFYYYFKFLFSHELIRKP
jgi:glycosyltransferase involved in cell wall biosynthesis